MEPETGGGVASVYGEFLGLPTRVTALRLSGPEYPPCLECLAAVPALRKLHHDNVAHFLGIGCRGAGTNLVRRVHRKAMTCPQLTQCVQDILLAFHMDEVTNTLSEALHGGAPGAFAASPSSLAR